MKIMTALLLALPAFAFAQDAMAPHPGGHSSLIGPRKFAERDGESLYRNVCQGCHQANAQGAAGAGAYPALAGNEKLEVAAYPVTMVLFGNKAMPPFGEMMDDEQIAAVVSYVRSHFGNAYADNVGADTVAEVRKAGK